MIPETEGFLIGKFGLQSTASGQTAKLKNFWNSWQANYLNGMYNYIIRDASVSTYYLIYLNKIFSLKSILQWKLEIGSFMIQSITENSWSSNRKVIMIGITFFQRRNYGTVANFFLSFVLCDCCIWLLLMRWKEPELYYSKEYRTKAAICVDYSDLRFDYRVNTTGWFSFLFFSISFASNISCMMMSSSRLTLIMKSSVGFCMCSHGCYTPHHTTPQ